MIVPTLYLQIAAVACLLTAGLTGRAAERHRDPMYGLISVLSLLAGAGLLAVLLDRMHS